MKRNTYVMEWQRACENVAQFFAVKYFGQGAEVYWVADDVGGVLAINDHFFNVNDMVDYIRYDYSKKKMFEHYEYALNQASSKAEYTINIKNYKKLI